MALYFSLSGEVSWLKCVGQQYLNGGCSAFKLDPKATVNGELTSDGQSV